MFCVPYPKGRAVGFVYNNYWEALCRTYFELNGFFVMSNVFVSLFVPEHAKDDAEAGEEREKVERRVEADLIACKVEGTSLSQWHIPLDEKASREPTDLEFLAGTEGETRLVYCEVRAYLQSASDGLADHFKDDANILKKIESILARFQKPPEQLEVVLIGHRISDKSKKNLQERSKTRKEKWAFKELTDIFWFVARRFEACKEKLGIMYNDPCLEVMRGFFGSQPLAQLTEVKF